MHKLENRTYVNRDSTKVVDEGSAEAAFLLGNAGDEISEETALRLGLVKAPEESDPSKMKKDELVAYAASKGVDTSGTKDEILARLEAAPEPAGGTTDVGSPDATASTGSPA